MWIIATHSPFACFWAFTRGMITLAKTPLGYFTGWDSWSVLGFAALTTYWYARHFPPGPSFTYAWLWVGLLSMISGTQDACALFYIIGFGLITGWYTTQILQRDIWDRLLVYWLRLWPSWCVSTAVRCGDFLIHMIPFAYSLRFYHTVGLHHVFQAILYERVYFLAIEGSLIGTGAGANVIYALHPPCRPQIFRMAQMLSTVGYFFASTVYAGSGRQFLQALWLSLYVSIAFGTIGLLNSVTAKLPEMEAVSAFFSEWEEDVNGKVSTYIQTFRDILTQLSMSNSDSPLTAFLAVYDGSHDHGSSLTPDVGPDKSAEGAHKRQAFLTRVNCFFEASKPPKTDFRQDRSVQTSQVTESLTAKIRHLALSRCSLLPRNSTRS